MTIKMTATTAKAKLLALLDEVAEGQEVEITKRGRVVARLFPAGTPHDLRGIFVGVASTAGPEEGLFSTGTDWETSDRGDRPR
jgi:prevent-host-death family protein